MPRDLRVPFASTLAVRRRMQRQARESTGPEVALRRELFRMGCRFRVHVPLLEGRARKVDVVLRRHRLAVFVDGCFWHACPKHGTKPRVNQWYWEAKLVRNRARDRDTDRRLRSKGWKVVRVWEHEEPSEAAERILRWICEQRSGTKATARPAQGNRLGPRGPAARSSRPA